MLFGFIGTGAMGAPLARNLVRAGKEVVVFNRTRERCEAVLAAGPSARRAESPADLAPCDTIFTCLPKPGDVLDRMLGTDGSNGVYALMKRGAIHVETSTIDPSTAHTLAEHARKYGIAYVQCTLGKTPALAEKAQEPLFIGGDEAAIRRLADIFPLIGVPNQVGSTDAACAVKLISNLVGMANLAVLAQGLQLGMRAGLDLATLLPLLADTGARSFQMDVRGPMMVEGRYTPGFALELAHKDLVLGCDMAGDWSVPVPLFEQARELFARALQQGLGKKDCAALFLSLTQQGTQGES